MCVEFSAGSLYSQLESMRHTVFSPPKAFGGTARGAPRVQLIFQRVSSLAERFNHAHLIDGSAGGVCCAVNTTSQLMRPHASLWIAVRMTVIADLFTSMDLEDVQIHRLSEAVPSHPRASGFLVFFRVSVCLSYSASPLGINLRQMASPPPPSPPAEAIVPLCACVAPCACVATCACDIRPAITS